MSREDLNGVVVVARFNEFVTERLLHGAHGYCEREGLSPPLVLRVPGAWEIPLAVDRALATGRFDFAVALGALIRGETYHFEVLSDEVTRALSEIARTRALPIGMGVLTVENVEQAVARAGDGSANKGWEAALAAVDMARLLRGID
jgi:6,7-dimethyl-8-ribityllumazine synthase